MSNPEDYTVGWICAISTEYVAAQAFLDEKHERPQHVSRHDNNDYTLGTVGKHNVVIAVLPEGEYGISSAATVARDMLHSFPNVRIGLMVGIGGGAPSRKHDIRLGDIVVSAPRDGKGGVFQYDFGKTIQDQSFRPTGFLDQPPMVLRTAIGGLKAQYESEGHRLEESINSILEEKPRLQKKYKRPDPSNDRLYQSKIIHPPNDEESCAVLCGDDPSNLVPRLERTKSEDNPAIYYGLIASANQLMKDALIRDRLAAEKDVLCFEMEAAGLMNHFPCLVIRGICDYSDSHKNKDWQGYAAMAAAAYAKDILCRIPPNKVEAEKKISAIISDVQAGVNKLVRAQYDQEHEAILKWLTPINYASQQNDFISRRQAGTGDWLLNSDQFRAWIDQSNQTLFCPGIPGAGKTISAAIVIDQLYSKSQSDSSIGIAYVYCNFRQQYEQKPLDLLASLLKQLIQGLPSVPQNIQQLYGHHQRTRTRPSFDEISQTLHSILPHYSKKFVIVDALDECEVTDGGRKRFLQELFNLQTKTAVNLFVTSRFIPEIEREFDGKAVRLEIRANDEDVRRYLDGHMTLLPSFVLRSMDLQNEIDTEIVKAVQGMFLLAQLHLDSLIGSKSIKTLRKALRELPKGSTAYAYAYEEAMGRIQGQIPNFRELAKQVLSWIIYAKRPLTTLELQHALAVEIGESKLDNENIPEVEDMISVCAGLVTVDKENNIIRLIHYTTQEFFERTGKDWFPKAEADIGKICSTYLSFDIFESGFCPTDRAFEARLQLNPLYDYTAQNWGHHMYAGPVDIQYSIPEFLKNEAKISACSQAIMVNNSLYGDYSQNVPRQMRGMHLAAWFGLAEMVDRLIKGGYTSDCKDSRGRTPLSRAAENGHAAVVRLLLARADVEADSKDTFYGQTPLWWAAANGHEAVVRLLLARADVEADSKDTNGRTPLWWAAGNGHEAVIRLLLARADVQADSNDEHYGRTPLSWAAEKGHEAVVRLLLARVDVEADSKDTNGQTPLSSAAENGHEAVVRLLLARADVEADSKDTFYGQTPLWWAAANGHEAVVRLLLARADVEADSKDTNGQTPLSSAAENGHEAVVRLLLARADVEADSKDGGCQTPLWWAAANGHEAVIRLLLARADVEADSKDTNGRTSLWWAARNGHETVIRLLLARADVEADSKDTNGQTPLSWAAENGHEAVVKLLLARVDVEADSNDTNGRTPLWWAAGNGHETVIRLLLARADVEADSKDTNGRTPLSWAAENGHEAVVRLLLARADVEADSKDTFYGQTPLWWAAENGHETVVRLLNLRTRRRPIPSPHPPP